MYLILKPHCSSFGHEPATGWFEAIFSVLPNDALVALEKEGVRVFKLDNLKEVVNIDAKYQEVIKEIA